MIRWNARCRALLSSSWFATGDHKRNPSLDRTNFTVQQRVAFAIGEAPVPASIRVWKVGRRGDSERYSSKQTITITITVLSVMQAGLIAQLRTI
jgi:hypothetical protein